MQKLIIVFFFALFCGIACGRQNKNEVQRIDPEVDTLSTIQEKNNLTSDSLNSFFERKGVVVRPKDYLSHDIGIYVYFSHSNKIANNLKLYIKYYAYNVYQFNIDDNKYTYKTEMSKGRGDSKEFWYDYPVKEVDMRFLRDLIKSKRARAVFSDGTSILVDEATKIKIKKTLDYFKDLGGEFPSDL